MGVQGQGALAKLGRSLCSFGLRLLEGRESLQPPLAPLPRKRAGDRAPGHSRRWCFPPGRLLQLSTVYSVEFSPTSLANHRPRESQVFRGDRTGWLNLQPLLCAMSLPGVRALSSLGLGCPASSGGRWEAGLWPGRSHRSLFIPDSREQETGSRADAKGRRFQTSLRAARPQPATVCPWNRARGLQFRGRRPVGRGGPELMAHPWGAQGIRESKTEARESAPSPMGPAHPQPHPQPSVLSSFPSRAS